MAKKNSDTETRSWGASRKAAIDEWMNNKTHDSELSTIKLYMTFNDISDAIKKSVDYNEMDVVDREKLKDSIDRIEVVLKQMIGSEALHNFSISNLNMDIHANSKISDQLHSPDEDADATDDTEDGIIENFRDSSQSNFFGHMHGFDLNTIAKKLLNKLKSSGYDKLTYIGMAIIANDVRKIFGDYPKSGDLIHFAYCKNPTFIFYTDTGRYIIYQYDTNTDSVKKLFSTFNINKLEDFLITLEVDSSAFDKHFNSLKLVCRRRGINFNVLYRKILECYSEESRIGAGHVASIQFRPTKLFTSIDDCVAYAQSQGYDGNLFRVDDKWVTESGDTIDTFFVLVVYNFGSDLKADGRAKYFRIGVAGNTAISMDIDSINKTDKT